MDKLQNAQLNIKTVDISCNHNLHWDSLELLCKLLKLWKTEKLILSIESLLDSITANIISNFKNKLLSNLFNKPSLFYTTLQLIYVTEESKAFGVLVSRNHSKFHIISCFEFTHCTLNDDLIQKLTDFIIVKIDTIECSYINNRHASEIMSLLSDSVKEVTLVGPCFYFIGILNLAGSLNNLSQSVTVVHQYRTVLEVILANVLAAIYFRISNQN